MRPFQLVLLAVFALLAIVALVFLTIYQSERKQDERAYGDKVIIWGTLSQEIFKDTFQEIVKSDKAFNVVEYKEIKQEDFDSEFINAIAEGRSPDLIVLESSALVKHRVKLVPIPYESFSLRDFKNTYIDGAELFALEEGVYGLPFAINPVVLYWNRDLFASNGLAQAPTSWEEIVSTIVPSLTIRDTNRNVLQSGLAFGEFRNIAHAKEILMLLTLQSGSKMVIQQENQYTVDLNDAVQEGARAPLESAVQFYTDFSNVNSPLYSWNRALPSDKESFLAGDLGLYFGMGSEYQELQNKNPNLNFDMAMVPQGATATALRTYADMYAFAIPKASKHVQEAFAVAKVLESPQNVPGILERLNMSSARRALISQGDENLYRKVILQSALIARSWFDPSAQESDAIFMQMIEDVTSNRSRISEAVNDAIDRLILAY